MLFCKNVFVAHLVAYQASVPSAAAKRQATISRAVYGCPASRIHHFFFMNQFRHFLSAAVLALAAAGAHAAPPGPHEQVQALLASGQNAQAIKRAEEHIAANPEDAQMRFILANALAAAGRSQEAQTLLRQLCDEFPELAEPWNNLAVLHAAAGRLDDAATALQEAVRLNPAYATAWENLGEVRVRQAHDAWQQASKDAALRARLAPHLKSLRAMAAQGNVGAAPADAAPKKADEADEKTAAKDGQSGAKAAKKSTANKPAAKGAAKKAGAKAKAAKKAKSAGQ